MEQTNYLESDAIPLTLPYQTWGRLASPTRTYARAKANPYENGLGIALFADTDGTS